MTDTKRATERDVYRRLMSGIDDIAPVIGNYAKENEEERRLHPSVVEALHELGAFKLLLPESLGGFALDPGSFVRVVEKLATLDASTAWVICQTAATSMVWRYLTEVASETIFGANPVGVIAWGPPAGPGKAVERPGGYVVSGTWQFASGSREASWLGGTCDVYAQDGKQRLRADGSPDRRTFLFPSSNAEFQTVWDVIGLSGTGSEKFTVANVEVDEAFSVARDDERPHGDPGLLFDNAVTAPGFAGIALGVARRLLDSFVDLARNKTPRGQEKPLRESEVAQAEIALAEARLRSVRTYLLATVEQEWKTAGASSLSIEQRANIRLATTHGIQEAMAIADYAYHASGSTAIFKKESFERPFRDMHAIAQQGNGRRDQYEQVGKLLLGLEPNILLF